MVQTKNSNQKINLKLLQEALWNIEDKMKSYMESIADHEAELIRLKRQFNIIRQRITNLETKAK
ncbi:MAG: hypothetical protein DRP46_03765 [Candidatus Zixiibacteriota bacterium]|nr:MAG: hypothetical protein DRP46_03765 [candidate division Zixibacteria bacterium]